VHNIDMSSAYATFAAKGEAAEWHTVKQVTGSNGGSRYKAKVKKSRALDEDVTADVSYALQQVVKNGTGAAAQGLGRPAAGKTGTASDISAWFVGYTPQLSAAVDFYNGDGTKSLDGVGGLETFFGAKYPAQVWTAFMKGALKGQKVLDFPPPANVGKALNPKPSVTATPTPTKSSATPTPTTSSAPPTTTTAPPTPTPTTPKPSVSVSVPGGGGGGGSGGGGGGGGGGPPASGAATG
jgi:membrane peptidoglycan carboxypeptidase